MADADGGQELEAIRRQMAALQARVEELASLGTGATAPRGETARGPRPAGDELEEVDVARVGPKPGEMVGIGEGVDGRTVVRRVPLSSLGGSGKSVVPLGYDMAMYLTRLLHRDARAEPGGGISESFSNDADEPLSLSGDAGLLAIQTATGGTPARITVHAMPFVQRERGTAAEEIADLQKVAERGASDLEPLASAPRLAILLYLRQAARSSTELQQGLGLAPGQMYHHLKPLAAAGFLRRDGQGRYAISGRGRKALLAAQLLSTEVSRDRFSETLERVSEANGDTRYQVFAAERSSDVPLGTEGSEESGTAGN